MEQINENQWKSTLGEYLKWYLFAPEDRGAKKIKVAFTFARNCENGGYYTEAENIACVLYLQDEESKKRLSDYCELLVFAYDHFDDEIVITCQPEKMCCSHAFCVDGIKIELQAICDPFDDEEFNFNND